MINSPEKVVEEKYEMVALPTDKNDGTGSRKSHKMEAEVVMAQSWKYVGQIRNGMGRRRRLDESTIKEEHS